ncbi:MAG TPA: prolipoprotein diacylglyceryl transferase family protein [Noviherbaspirillum sp.]
MDSFQIGPLAFPTALVVFVAAVMVALFAGKRIDRAHGRQVETALWTILFVGVASARLAFLFIYWKSYAGNPWTVLDLRDGGFNIGVGVAGGLLMAGLLAFRSRVLRKPLAVSLASAAVLWTGLTLVLSAEDDTARLPPLALANLDGKPVSIESFSGKPVVVNLWATWCPPCRREMPVFRQAQQANKDITFVFANQGESPDSVRGFLDAEGLVLQNVLLDPGGNLAKAVGSVAMPTTLFYDRAGKLVGTRIGQVSEATLMQRLQALREAP